MDQPFPECISRTVIAKRQCAGTTLVVAYKEEGDSQGDNACHDVVIERILLAAQDLAHDHDGHDLEALGQDLQIR